MKRSLIPLDLKRSALSLRSRQIMRSLPIPDCKVTSSDAFLRSGEFSGIYSIKWMPLELHPVAGIARARLVAQVKVARSQVPCLGCNLRL